MVDGFSLLFAEDYFFGAAHLHSPTLHPQGSLASLAAQVHFPSGHLVHSVLALPQHFDSSSLQHFFARLMAMLVDARSSAMAAMDTIRFMIASRRQTPASLRNAFTMACIVGFRVEMSRADHGKSGAIP